MIDSSFKFAGIAGAMALAISASVVAQDPEQWRVEDGGNGHWYGGVDHGSSLSWYDAEELAEMLGGHLATPSTSTENAWLKNNVANDRSLWSASGIKGPWFGGFRSADNEWGWVDGSEWSFENWHPGNPNESLDQDAALSFWERNVTFAWQDHFATSELGSASYLVEWSADCNGDGIVDYGQIRDGTFEDTNGNGVPDICKVTIFGDYESAVLTSEPIAYWRMNIDGGFVPNMIEGSPAAVVIGAPGTSESPVGCSDDLSIDTTGGNHLNAGEDARFDLSNSASFSVEAWIRRDGVLDQPAFILSQTRDIVAGGWDLLLQQDGGIAFRVTVIGPAVTSSAPIDVDRWVHVVGVIDDGRGMTSLYLDGVLNSEAEGGNPRVASNYPLLIGRHNFSAPYDWPFNGSIDEVAIYDRALTPDEILSHYLSADPDKACTPPCPADITGDGQVDAADLGALIAVWNTDGGTIPEADINRDGTVSAADLGLLIGAWGPCP